jgi:transcriptional regulator with XRE-family HTH domain
MRTVDLLFEELDVSVEEIAERSKIPFKRLEAIALGRWTPSSIERQRVAEAFGVTVAEISWGHTMDPRNIRYRRYGFDEPDMQAGH